MEADQRSGLGQDRGRPECDVESCDGPGTAGAIDVGKCGSQGVGDPATTATAGGSGAATGCQLPYASGRITGGLLPSTMTMPRWNGTRGRRVLHLDHLRVARQLMDQDAREPRPVGGPQRRSATPVTDLIELALVAAVGIDDPGANGAGPVVHVLRRVHRAVEGELPPVGRPRRIARPFGEQTLTRAVGLRRYRCPRRPRGRSPR